MCCSHIFPHMYTIHTTHNAHLYTPIICTYVTYVSRHLSHGDVQGGRNFTGHTNLGLYIPSSSFRHLSQADKYLRGRVNVPRGTNSRSSLVITLCVGMVCAPGREARWRSSSKRPVTFVVLCWLKWKHVPHPTLPVHGVVVEETKLVLHPGEKVAPGCRR